MSYSGIFREGLKRLADEYDTPYDYINAIRPGGTKETRNEKYKIGEPHEN
jgi:hypothetical protein